MSQESPPQAEFLEVPQNEGDSLKELSPWRRWAGRLGLAGSLTLGSLVGGTVAIESLGPTEGEVCALSAEIEHSPLTVDPGPSVEAEIAPGVRVAFYDVTENKFLRTRVRITDIRRDEAIELQKKLARATTEDLKALEKTCREDATELVERSGKKALVVGGVGAAMTSLAVFGLIETFTQVDLTRKKRIALLLACNFAAALPGTGSLLWGSQTVNEQAFTQPEYRGLIKDIERIVDSGELTLDGYQKQSGELTKWLEQTTRLQQELVATTEQSAYLKFLIISDVHSRPCAYARADVLADAYDVSFALNPGDEYEWTERESGLLVPEGSCDGIDGPDDLEVDVIQVKGNHDSEKAMILLDQLDNVTVLNYEPTTIPYKVGGIKDTLTIAGIPDVRYTPDDELEGRDEPKTNLLELYSRETLTTVAQTEPDILLTHDPLLLKEMQEEALIPDSVSLLSAGHTHKPRLDTESFSAPLLVTGSSGGGGLRTFEGEGQPSEYSVVFMDPETKKVARVELISVSNDGAVNIKAIAIE